MTTSVSFEEDCSPGGRSSVWAGKPVGFQNKSHSDDSIPNNRQESLRVREKVHLTKIAQEMLLKMNEIGLLEECGCSIGNAGDARLLF